MTDVHYTRDSISSDLDHHIRYTVSYFTQITYVWYIIIIIIIAFPPYTALRELRNGSPSIYDMHPARSIKIYKRERERDEKCKLPRALLRVFAAPRGVKTTRASRIYIHTCMHIHTHVVASPCTI